jgi:hypothetical protein
MFLLEVFEDDLYSVDDCSVLLGDFSGYCYNKERKKKELKAND